MPITEGDGWSSKITLYTGMSLSIRLTVEANIVIPTSGLAILFRLATLEKIKNNFMEHIRGARFLYY